MCTGHVQHVQDQAKPYAFLYLVTNGLGCNCTCFSCTCEPQVTRISVVCYQCSYNSFLLHKLGIDVVRSQHLIGDMHKYCTCLLWDILQHKTDKTHLCPTNSITKIWPEGRVKCYSTCGGSRLSLTDRLAILSTGPDQHPDRLSKS